MIIRAFVINLEQATDRLARLGPLLDRAGLPWQRVAAIHGSGIQLPSPEFAEKRFRLLHGRATNVFEIGCYLSHVQAMRAFLETEEEIGLICEDDIVPEPDFPALLKAAIAEKCWNVLRLSGLSQGGAVPVRRLCASYDLCVNLQRLKGAGAYLVDRRAAQALAGGLLPMWLPFDHAVDREWVFGLRAMCVYPFPISQTTREFRTSIQSHSQPKVSRPLRSLTVHPYQAMNEMSRFFFRSSSLLAAQIAALGSRAISRLT